MSESRRGGADGPTSQPRALIHKKILEAAAQHPDATMEDIADEVVGASTDLVDRVLEEYGDPAETTADSDDGVDAGPGDGESVQAPTDDGSPEGPDEDDGEDEPAGSTEADPGGEQSVERGAGPVGREVGLPADVPDPAELTDKELAVLEEIAEHPAATQEALAEELGVSRATISKRANGIEGFAWRHRERFVEAVFGGRPAPARPTASDGGVDESVEPPGERDDRPAEAAEDPSDGETATERGSTVPGSTEDGSDGAPGEFTADSDGSAVEAAAGLASGEATLGLEDPQLVHKVLRTCMESDRISEDEELRIVEAMLGAD